MTKVFSKSTMSQVQILPLSKYIMPILLYHIHMSISNTYPHPNINRWLSKLKSFGRDRVAQEIEKQLTIAIKEWRSIDSIWERLQQEVSLCLQEDIDNHQDIQEMTWHIKEVIDTMTLQRKTKQEIIDRIRMLLNKYEWDWREPTFLNH